MTFAPFLAPFFVKKTPKRNPGEPLIEDPSALRQAELQANSQNLRQDLADKGFVVVEEFYNMHGFDGTYMTNLVQTFHEQGIETYYETLWAVPAGILSVNSTGGVHLLYCHSDAREAVKLSIDRMLKT